MGEFFGSIYCWLEEFFGLELADYLWGLLAPMQQGNMYIGIGLTMLGVSLLIAVTYYYIIDHPKLNHWWVWLLVLILNAVINFIIAWQWVLKDYYDGMMVSECAETGELIPLNITESDILAFATTNMFDAVIAFFIFSFIIKWWSRNTNAPF